MGVEPAGDAGEQRGVDEHAELDGGRLNAERRARQRIVTQRAHRAPHAAAQEIARRHHRQRDRDEHHDEVVARAGQRVLADAQRRDAGQAVMAAEALDVGEQVVERDAPGDGAERQIVA